MADSYSDRAGDARTGRAALAGTPGHIAIIMDGNGRWAADRGLPRAMGHRAGVEAVRRTVEAAADLGIPYLTLYSFSSENWSRPADEISDLMGLMKRFVRRDLAELHKSNVRIVIIGERTNVESDMLSLLDEAQQLTASNTGLTLVIAFNYGARSEIAEAARRVARMVAAGELDAEAVTADVLAANLCTCGIPDPDLLIRTSGEMRLSNFLLWQAAYAELVFVDANWPDFGMEMLQAAIAEYQGRDRRFGGLSKRSSA
ncbi:MAG: isoprenyl transferase [Hyphomicrobium sp.]